MSETVGRTIDPTLHPALSRRDMFAMAALQGLLSTLTINREDHIRLMVSVAAQYADALIEQLDKNQGEEKC